MEFQPKIYQDSRQTQIINMLLVKYKELRMLLLQLIMFRMRQCSLDQDLKHTKSVKKLLEESLENKSLIEVLELKTIV